MKFIKFIILTIFCVGLIVFASGCNREIRSESNNSNENAKTEIIIDSMGREVEVPSSPKRILALHASLMEDLFIMGLAPVGKVEDYTYRQEGVDLPSVGQKKNINIEAVCSLKPDLILANSTFHGALLDSLGSIAPVLFFGVTQNSSEDIFEELKNLGNALGKQKEVNTYIEKVNALSSEIREKTKDSPLKTAIVLLGGTDAVYAFHPYSYPGSVMSLIGFKNVVSPDLTVSKESGSGAAVAYDIETIIKQDPDVIMIRSGSLKVEDSEIIYHEDPLYKDLRSLKNGHIYLMPANINVGTISIEEAMKITAVNIYPEIFKDW